MAPLQFRKVGSEAVGVGTIGVDGVRCHPPGRANTDGRQPELIHLSTPLDAMPTRGSAFVDDATDELMALLMHEGAEQFNQRACCGIR